MKKLIFAMIAGATAMGAAHAQQSSPYVGLAVASSDNAYKIGGGTNVDGDGWKPSVKVFGGVDFTPTWGVEAGYTDLRKADFSYNTGNVRGTGEADGKRAYLAAKATMPLNEQVSFYGKLGAGYQKTEFNASTVGVSRNESDTGVYAGVGAQYKLNQQVALTLEYERYGKKKDFGAKADAVTVGARYNF